MLKVVVPSTELWDKKKEEFVQTEEQVLTLEHSLISISKWEAKWQRPFMSEKPMSAMETLDYIRCMTITKNVKPEVYSAITQDIINTIVEYIESPMTATTFSEHLEKPKAKKEVITSELIYYQMIALEIPFECQRWHINRLMTLIRICSIKNAPPKKMGKNAILNKNRALNAARRKSLGTRG